VRARSDIAFVDAASGQASQLSYPASRIEAVWASCESDVQAAQRLRHAVFAGELGARLGSRNNAQPDIDVDRFDAFCDHLLVRVVRGGHDGDGDVRHGLVVGTYRVLSPQAARRAGGLYTDTEFDLSPLGAIRARAVELGRSCVHPAWRSGPVILALWSALGRYMSVRGLDTMIGCASVSLADGGWTAAQLWHRLQQTHLAPAQWQVCPRIPLPLEAIASACEAGHAASARGDVPPLIKGYLRCGARVLGPPALDRAFNTADLPIMLRTGDMTPRYRRRFLGA
jgi:putative hemolysin